VISEDKREKDKSFFAYIMKK